jgi:hypothetical protein
MPVNGQTARAIYLGEPHYFIDANHPPPVDETLTCAVGAKRSGGLQMASAHSWNKAKR